jgi:putative hydrolase of the HAD superfamily
LIIVFDLDDTLYQEITYVKSGLKAVADEIAEKYKMNSKVVYRDSLLILEKSGRGKIFDTLLKDYGFYTRREVQRLVSIYRFHKPEIKIGKRELKALNWCSTNSNLYLVTDGNKFVQAKKIESLGISEIFTRIFITHRFGLDAAKPSLKCFEIIRKSENVSWAEIVYIGDDPNKDFIELKKAGAITIRVRTGRFASIKKSMEYEADWHIDSLEELPAMLRKIDSHFLNRR